MLSLFSLLFLFEASSVSAFVGTVEVAAPGGQHPFFFMGSLVPCCRAMVANRASSSLQAAL
jgi:hypothetical protein